VRGSIRAGRRLGRKEPIISETGEQKNGAACVTRTRDPLITNFPRYCLQEAKWAGMTRNDLDLAGICSWNLAQRVRWRLKGLPY